MGDLTVAPDSERMTTTDLDAESARFLADFESFPEIAELSPAARRILASAAVLFYRDGAAATSVRDLTKACGLTPGALYSHFASRNDLLHVLVRNGFQTSERAVIEALADSDDPDERLSGYVRAYAGTHLRFPAITQLADREYVHLTGPPRADVESRRLRLRELLIAVLTAGERQGSFQPLDGLPVAGQADMMLDLCGRANEWFTTELVQTEPAEPALAERYVEAALRLVGAKRA